jgi:hypothetical protein
MPDKAFRLLTKGLERLLDSEASQRLTLLVLRVLSEALQPETATSPNEANVAECLKAEGVRALTLILEQCTGSEVTTILLAQAESADGSVPQLLDILQFSLRCLALFSTSDVGQRSVATNPELLSHVLHMVRLEQAMVVPTVTLHALTCVAVLIECLPIQSALVEAGVLPLVLQTALFHEISEVPEPMPTDEGEDVVEDAAHAAALASQQEGQEVVNSATTVLVSLAKSGASESTEVPLTALLRVMLTPGLHRELLGDKPEAFLHVARSPGERDTPLLIWNDTMRASLCASLETEVANIDRADSSPRWNATEFLTTNATFQTVHSSVEEEIIVADVYVSRFVAQTEWDFNGETEPSALTFLNALIEQLVRAQQAKNVEALRLLLAALELLLQKHTELLPAAASNAGLRSIPAIITPDETQADLRMTALRIMEMFSIEAHPDVIKMLNCFLPMLHASLRSPEMQPEEQMQLMRVLNTVLAHNIEANAVRFVSCGLLLTLLDVVLCARAEYARPARLDAARVLGAIIKAYGPAQEVLLLLFNPLFAVPATHREALVNVSDDPERFLIAIEEEYEQPNLIWNDDTRADLKAFVVREMETLAAHTATPDMESVFDGDVRNVERRFDRPTLDKELFVAGVFVREFIESPLFSEMDASAFLTALLQGCNTQFEYVCALALMDCHGLL